MEKSQEEIIKKVMALMQDNLPEPMSIPSLAKKVGYSPSHLRYIFRQATGKGILPHFMELRITKAKELLRDTKLTVSEIAFESGFNSYKRFRSAFQIKVGCAPGQFRKSGRGEDAPSAFSSSVKGKKKLKESLVFEPLKGSLSDFCKTSSGDWQHGPEGLKGRASGSAMFMLKEPIPENCLLQFEVFLFRKQGLSSAEFEICLHGDDGHGEYYRFSLGRMNGAFGDFRVLQIPLLLNSRAVLSQEIWHELQMEFRDDTLTLSLNGEEIFKYREPFPPPYVRRSHLAFAVENSEILVRNLRIFDQGFFPLVKSVRQGDSLYNAGQYPAARDFYQRLMTSQTSTADTAELCCKIGRCFFREENKPQARDWMEKVVRLPETGFWADQAKETLLELDIQEERFERIENYLGIFFEKPQRRQGIRLILNRVSKDLSNRGFYEKSHLLIRRLFEMEEPDSFPKIEAQSSLAEILTQMRKWEESENHFRSVCENPSTPIPHRIYTLFSFCNNLGIQGKKKEWWDVLENLNTFSDSTFFPRKRLHAYRAQFFLANETMEKALEELSRIQTNPYWISYACLIRVSIYCSMRKDPEARNALAEAIRLAPGRVSPGNRSRYEYPIELSCGNYEKAANLLTEDSEKNLENNMGAEQAIKGGILFALAGKQEEAHTVWKRTVSLFPGNRINFYEDLAQSLISGKPEAAFAMPYPAEKRSEMFYLLGLLCEFQGNPEMAQSLYKSSVAEDRLCNWPALMAREKIKDAG